MTKPALYCPGVMALVGEGVAAGVAQHVRVRLELLAGARCRTLDPGEAVCGERRSALTDEDEGRWQDLSLEPPRRPGSGGGRCPVLDPPDVLRS
jgi:hypothetical protein